MYTFDWGREIMKRTTTTLLAAVLALAVGYACSDSTGPEPSSQLAVVPIQLSSAPQLSTLVVEVTAADLDTPLVFNLQLVGGTASDTLSIPAGSDRLITVRGYDANSIETHRGSVTIDLQEGENPAVTIRLDALGASQPVIVVLGTVTVEVSPLADTIASGATTTLAAVVVNEANDTLDVTPTWASMEPAVATVDTAGIVTGVAAGEAVIVASYGGVAASATIVVDPGLTALTSLDVVFSRVNVPSYIDLYSMRADGSNVQFIAQNTNATQIGDVLIARGAYLDNQIYRMTATGTDRTVIVPDGYGPHLAPDTSRFTFFKDGGCPGASHLLRMANADGSNEQAFTECSENRPRWSPLGDRITIVRNDSVFTVDTTGVDRQLVLAAAQVNLAVSSVPGGRVTWSPDASRFAFTAYTPSASAGMSAFFMNVDGTGVQQLTPVAATYDDKVLGWSPDGDWLLIASTRSGFDEIWAYSVDGTSTVQLTDDQVSTETKDGDWIR